MKSAKQQYNDELVESYHSYLVVVAYRAMMQAKGPIHFTYFGIRHQKALAEWREFVAEAFKVRYYK